MRKRRKRKRKGGLEGLWDGMKAAESLRVLGGGRNKDLLDQSSVDVVSYFIKVLNFLLLSFSSVTLGWARLTINLWKIRDEIQLFRIHVR